MSMFQFRRGTWCCSDCCFETMVDSVAKCADCPSKCAALPNQQGQCTVHLLNGVEKSWGCTDPLVCESSGELLNN